MDHDPPHHHHDHGRDGGFRFCPRCGGSLDKRRIKTGEPPRLVCRDCSFVFYLDPKVVAGTLFRIRDRVVLLKRGIEPELGRWVFPGGYVDRGESLLAAAIRETKEEAAVDVRLSSLLGVYSYPGQINVVVVYAAEVVGGEPAAGDEAVEARAFAPADIPWDKLAFRSTRDALRDYLKLYADAKS
jgi:ADP-ribose pyrophosphatase YjhB (NUDIX family)